MVKNLIFLKLKKSKLFWIFTLVAVFLAAFITFLFFLKRGDRRKSHNIYSGEDFFSQSGSNYLSEEFQESVPIEFDQDGLPISWPKYIPLYSANFELFNTFSIGDSCGLVLGVKDSYERVGQYYQTLSSRVPGWQKTYLNEEDGQNFVTYEYTNLERGQLLRVVVYNRSQGNSQTIYSLSYSNFTP